MSGYKAWRATPRALVQSIPKSPHEFVHEPVPDRIYFRVAASWAW